MLSLNVKIQNRLRLIYVVTDFVTTYLAVFLFNVFRVSLITIPLTLSEYYHYPKVLWGQVLFPLMMMAIYWLSGYYNKVDERSRAQEAILTMSSAILGSLGIFFLAVVNDSAWSRTLVLEYLLMLSGLLFVCVYCGRYLITTIELRRTRAAHKISHAVMLGTDEEAFRLACRINESSSNDGMKIHTFVRLNGEDFDGVHNENFVIIERSDLSDYCQTHAVNRMILTPKVMGSGKEVASFIRLAADIKGALFVSPDVNSLVLASHRSFNVVGEPLVCISNPNIPDSTANIKRAVDVVGASVAMVLLSPLMLFLAIKVKCDSKGPVFFRQERLGYGGRPFEIIKFRSMRADAESGVGPQVTVDGDPRITHFGRFLRKYRLDELPQFWNVIKGDMSLVGPRPERRYFAEMIAARVPQYPFIYQVRPGITSWGMVRYGYASNLEQMIERLRYDLIYLENISILTDIKILLHTVRTVVGGHGK